MTAYDPDLCERLAKEAREMDLVTHRAEPECDNDGCIADAHSDLCAKHEHRHAVVDAWTWKEINLRAMADQLDAARAEIDRLRDLTHQLPISALAKAGEP